MDQTRSLDPLLRAERVLDRLTALLHYPPRDRMPCVLLFGATGMGKTSLVQKFLRDYRSSFDAVLGRTRLPVVSIQMPPAPNERDFYEEILVSMGGVLVAGISITTLATARGSWRANLKLTC